MKEETNGLKRRVVTYERVSSEDQRDRETIRSQTAELVKRLEGDGSVVLVGRHIDDGVSGTIPLAERPAGRRLLEDARKGLFDEVWVLKLDRLGRDDIDPLIVRRELERLGVKVVAIWENIENPLEYAMRVAFAAEERRTFLARSAAGMEQAARAGRYCGGIVALGYKVCGERHDAFLVESDVIIWADWTEAELVRRIYHWLGVERRTCPWIASELNRLGVPTAYQKDARGVRGKKTQGKWRPGRIRNLVLNPVYKGVLPYGRRSKRPRTVIEAECPPLVSVELWEAAQATLRANLIIPKNTNRVYLLRSLIYCGRCGLRYSGVASYGRTYYRCNGYQAYRGPLEGRCDGAHLRGGDIEAPVWDDIERLLRDPGDLLEELQADREMDGAAAVREAERQTFLRALADLDSREEGLLDLRELQHVPRDKLDARFQKIAAEREQVQAKLQELERQADDEEDAVVSEPLFAQLHARLDAGLTAKERHEIVALLVRKITIYTENVDAKKTAKAVVEYRFPRVVPDRRDRGSSPPPA